MRPDSPPLFELERLRDTAGMVVALRPLRRAFAEVACFSAAWLAARLVFAAV
ncbi:MAG: hypothetical protein JNL39_02635 [Opitutaceae bacterium]|nr:hypothetical protein [Opitutaceae bacterium]